MSRNELDEYISDLSRYIFVRKHGKIEVVEEQGRVRKRNRKLTKEERVKIKEEFSKKWRGKYGNK